MDILSTDFHRLFVVIINIIVIWQFLVVSVSRKNSKTYRVFMAMAISMLLWVDLAYLARIVDSQDLSATLLRIGWVGALPFSFFLFFFTLDLIKQQNKYRNLLIFNAVITTILSLFTLLTDLIIIGVRSSGLELGIDYGSGMFPFLGAVLLLIGSNVFVLIKERRNITAETRKALHPFVIGLFTFYLLNVTFNVALPVMFGITRYYYFGDYSTVIMLMLISYSIVRHQFLGVKVVLSTLLISIIGVFQMLDLAFFSEDLVERVIKIFVFVLYLFISYLLIRTILNGIKQQEIIEKTNKALKKSEKRLADLAREQKDIIDVMGHEIRTPLTAIVQELDIQKKVTYPEWEKLLKGKLSDQDREKYLVLIRETLETTDRASTHALSLVGDMLETARLDKKKFSLNYEVFDIVDLLEDAVKLMSKTSNDPNVEIILKNKFKKLEIEADKTRINEAVIALLSNAMKYKDDEKDATSIEVNLRKKANYIEVEFTDNGIGIEQGDIKKLGAKFVRLDPKLNGSLKRPGGTGLGLFVVKGIMEYHGGALEIESEGLHKGSTFTLKFPLKKKGVNPLKN